MVYSGIYLFVDEKWNGPVKAFTTARVHARLYGRPISVEPYEQTVEAVKAMTELHYDERIIDSMIGKSRFYSCAYFKDALELDPAQWAKAVLLKNKIVSVVGRRKHMRILEIGGGNGTLAIYLANELEADVIMVTNSARHTAVTRERIAQGEVHRGSVTVYLRDVRRFPEDLEKFDAIVSVGMMEHVGLAQLRLFMETVRRFLKQDGVALLHFIYARLYGGTNPWLNARIFPGGELLLRSQVMGAIKGLFEPLDWHTFQNRDYERTSDAWDANLMTGRETENGVLMPDGNMYPMRLWRTMHYFVAYVSALFATGTISLAQLLLSPSPISNYQPIR